MNLDNNSKPKSIKEFSLVLMIISILMIFANTGAFIMTMFLKIDMSPSDDYVFANIGDKLFSWFTGHLNILYASLIIIGILLFVSSINLKKYRMWSNKLLTFISVFVLINVWIFFFNDNVDSRTKWNKHFFGNTNFNFNDNIGTANYYD